MYWQLGDTKYEGLKGFTEFSHKEEQVISQHMLIEGKPRLQNGGEKADEITIGIRINSQMGIDPKTEYETLRDYRKNATSLKLFDGVGQYYGDWVISTIEKTINNITPKGEWVEIDLSITLIENYYTDSLKEAEAEAKNNGFAQVNNMPTLSSGTIPLTGSAASISNDINKVSMDTNSIGNSLQNAQTFASKADSFMDNASNTISGITNTVGGLQQKLNDLIAQNKWVTEAGSLLTSLSAFQGALNSLAVPLSLHDLQSALGLNLSLQGQLSGLLTSAAPFAGLTTSLS